MKKKLKQELLERFGIDGNGELKKVEWLGRDANEITVEEFENWSGAELSDGQCTEYDSEDFRVVLIDEDGEDFELTLEVKNGIITHSYF